MKNFNAKHTKEDDIVGKKLNENKVEIKKNEAILPEIDNKKPQHRTSLQGKTNEVDPLIQSLKQYLDELPLKQSKPDVNTTECLGFVSVGFMRLGLSEIFN